MDKRFTEEYIERLAHKLKAGTITPEEQADFDAWYQSYNDTQFLHAEAHDPQSVKERMLNNVLAETHPDRKFRALTIWPRIAVAASILLAVSVGGFFILHKEKPPQQIAAVHDVLPGGNKAYLTLGNGQRISLTDAKNGTIASQAGKTIQKTADGMIVYDDSHNVHNNSENIFNTIETPRGGQYQVVLPDGSKVWLNAASSLKYPAAFTGTDRLVELTGEAYFEVAKDKAHPFKVMTAQQEVEVLGTHFDINSYSDEPAVATTLLEGSVKVTSGSKQRLISPGEQVLNDGQTLSIDKPNLDNITDWKDGDFNLEGLDFRVAMRKIARWYNIEVVYDPSLPDGAKTGGWVSRNRKLSTVLNGIAHSSQFKFKLEGGKVYVSK